MTTPNRTRVALIFGGQSTEHSISCASAAGVLSAIDRDRFEVIPIGITREGTWHLVPDDPAPLTLSPGNTPKITAASGPEIWFGAAPHTQGVYATLPDRGDQSFAAPGANDKPLSSSPPNTAINLEALEIEIVFPILHGTGGEDGTIQGLLEMANLPYVGAGIAASAAMMDKHLAKSVFQQAGMQVGPYITITDRQWAQDQNDCIDRCKALAWPVFVKPARGGSSVGITRATNEPSLRAAIAEAQKYDQKIVVEAAIVGREIECAVLEGRFPQDPRASVPGEILVLAEDAVYDFDTKYRDPEKVELSCPAVLPESATKAIRAAAITAFSAAGCAGLSRVDFFYTAKEEIIINEINTMPGFTPSSLYPRMWEHTGLPYSELISELIDLAIDRHARRQSKTVNWDG